jgi:hypothetical protein
MQEEYLSRTGQVSPGTNNPQNSSAELYEQSGQTDIQNTSDNILKGQSGSNILLPDGVSTVSPSNSNVSVNTMPVASTSSYALIGVIIPIALVVLVAIFVLIAARKKEDDNTEFDSEIEENEEVEVSQISIPVLVDDSAVEAQDSNSVEQPKVKQKKSGKKTKKRKKR